MGGKKAFIHRAQKEWSSDDGHDGREKNRIATILRNNAIRHYPLFDETIFISKQTHRWTKEHPKGYTSKEDLWRDYEIFKPDLLFPMKNMIIEIDGDWHFNTTKGVKQTNKRNEWYEYAGIKLIWFTAAAVKEMSDAELFLALVDRL